MKRDKNSLKFCQAQLLRLTGLEYFPASEHAQKELSDALVAAANDTDHAAAIVTAWIREHRERPTPADFFALAKEANLVVLPQPCPACADLHGYVRTKVKIQVGVFAGEECDAVTECSCVLGKCLAKAYGAARADAQRRAAQSEGAARMDTAAKVTTIARGQGMKWN